MNQEMIGAHMIRVLCQNLSQQLQAFTRPSFGRLCGWIVAILECQRQYRLRFQIIRKRFDEFSHGCDVSGVRIAQRGVVACSYCFNVQAFAGRNGIT